MPDFFPCSSYSARSHMCMLLAAVCNRSGVDLAAWSGATSIVSRAAHARPRTTRGEGRQRLASTQRSLLDRNENAVRICKIKIPKPGLLEGFQPSLPLRSRCPSPLAPCADC